MGLVVLIFGVVGLVRSEDFFAESEVGLVEFDGFEVELSFLSWVLIVGKLESVVGLMSLVLFLGNEILDVSLRNSVWFLVELSMVVLVSLVWFLDDPLVGLSSLVWFLTVEMVELVFFLIG